MSEGTDENSRGDMFARAAFVAALHATAGFLLLAILVFVVPRFALMFADFGAKLPAPTQLVLDLSHAVQRLAPLVILAAMVFLVADGLACYWLRTRIGHLAATAWNLAVLIVVVSLIAVAVWSMFLPVLRISEVVGAEKTSVSVEVPATAPRK
jgi:type IV pilus assembly protein PilC